MSFVHPLRCHFVLLGLSGLAVTLSGVTASEHHSFRISEDVVTQEGYQRTIRLRAGQTVEISARAEKPSQLPPNARLRVDWKLLSADTPEEVPRGMTNGQPQGREVDAFGIYTTPTPDWNKLLHALDPDVYVVYRAPVAGQYQLSIQPETGATDLFAGSRWREKGNAPQFRPSPPAVPWPAEMPVAISVALKTLDVESTSESGVLIEAEPNDTPEQAQVIKLSQSDDWSLCVTGTSDDIEYFDNGHVGRAGDDWFRIEYDGPESRMLKACLSIPDQQVVARIRAYRIPPENTVDGPLSASPGELLPLEEYGEGRNSNERAHQQPDNETHRTAINRLVEKSGVYFLRVEANAPAYDLELRLVKLAPYDDPHQAIREGLYDHIGQVDAWLANRPRGAAVERRIRDTGNLLGTNCMSCHTQSGVWGPALTFERGYRPRNVQLWRHLINTCYQSMRPTNKLEAAANNTSLQPFDLGDGPAGTRVAGHAVVALERFSPPRKLQSKQAIRAANYVLQTSPPSGINAAGPGANVGEGVVFNYGGEVLAAAWQRTEDPKYFAGLVNGQAETILGINVKYSDDLGHRVELLRRYLPQDYVTMLVESAKQKGLDESSRREVQTKAAELRTRIDRQVAEDLQRLRDIQLAEGGWGFSPGTFDEETGRWNTADTEAEPSPTALALLGFHAAGVSRDDPTAVKGLKALLEMQKPTGYWHKASDTGFVSTSYALHALARYYPVEPAQSSSDAYQPREGETLAETIQRVRQLSMSEDPRLVSLMVEAAAHESSLVRYWAMIGLGTTRLDEAVGPLVRGLGDATKPVREAAHWGVRQSLIDDRGWEEVLSAATSGDDFTRASAMRALVMKVDAVMPTSSVPWERLSGVLAHGVNHDPHPEVRAWAMRAAWHWWIWNPPIRPAVNAAWLELLQRLEPNALVENAIRYQTHALFIANGHVANATKEHQYPELKDLFASLQETLDSVENVQLDVPRRLAERLVAVAATFYAEKGGDGGPGQLGYSTPGAGKLFGDAILSQLDRAEMYADRNQRHFLTKLTLEGAANIPHEGLQERLVDYSLEGPESLRGLAAESISDPRLVKLTAVAEQLEPMHGQLLRGAADPPRRGDLADPIVKMIGGVSWILPDTAEQRRDILKYLLPDLSQWKTSEEITAIEDTVRRQQAEKSADIAWYLSNGLGDAIGKNPDLHFEQMAGSLPQEFSNHADARFWVRSIPWILTYKRQLPEVHVDPNTPPPVDPFEELRSRALRLFLTQLRSDALADNRQLGVELANQTALRRNPEVLTALAELKSFEENKEVLEQVDKVLSQERGAFNQQLVDAVSAEPDHGLANGEDGKGVLPDSFVEDVVYFRDYVVPEMSRVLRGDERSCMICHGEPGRVPSMELNAPDEVGFLPVEKLLANYRILTKRVNVDDVESSKLLRKPLNLQTGEEDGHQGGRRYQPMDPGYLILRKWVLNQVELRDLQ